MKMQTKFYNCGPTSRGVSDRPARDVELLLSGKHAVALTPRDPSVEVRFTDIASATDFEKNPKRLKLTMSIAEARSFAAQLIDMANRVDPKPHAFEGEARSYAFSTCALCHQRMDASIHIKATMSQNKPKRLDWPEDNLASTGVEDYE